MLKVNNRSTRRRYEICSKLTIKLPARRQWRRSGIFIVNFEHILHLLLCFYCYLWVYKCPLGQDLVNFLINSSNSEREANFLSIEGQPSAS